MCPLPLAINIGVARLTSEQDITIHASCLTAGGVGGVTMIKGILVSDFCGSGVNVAVKISSGGLQDESDRL